MAKSEKWIATDTAGVFRNEKGVLVDERGVAIAFKTLKAKDEAQREEVLGYKVKLPHELMYAVAMDPRIPLAIRLEQAHRAAPYYGRKLDVPGSGAPGNLDPEDAAAAINAAVRAADASVVGKRK